MDKQKESIPRAIIPKPSIDLTEAIKTVLNEFRGSGGLIEGLDSLDIRSVLTAALPSIEDQIRAPYLRLVEALNEAFGEDYVRVLMSEDNNPIWGRLEGTDND